MEAPESNAGHESNAPESQAAPESHAARQLATPLSRVAGLSRRAVAKVEPLGLRTVRDAIFNFPRDHIDLSEISRIADLVDDTVVTIVVEVVEIDQRGTFNGSITGVLFRQENDYLRGVWFNQAYMADKFRQGQQVLLSGRVRRKGMFWEMAHPKVRYLQDDEEAKGQILPVYRLTRGVNQFDVRRVTRAALTFIEHLEEVFPEPFLVERRLAPIRQALSQLHFPDDPEALAAARRRLVYQELFVLQLALALRRSTQRQAESPALETTPAIDARIRRLFPFQLTAGQLQVIGEVSGDMARTQPMNRLLQGEVGSGKTVVAAYALLLAVARGYQGAIMAPTEILARQHAATLRKLLVDSPVRVLELMGGLTPKQRDDALIRIAAGEADIVVGTQALIQDSVVFKALGVVVIDEQHKFGVKQRATLKHSGLRPHYLVMTATPIPRSLTMTLFGDLDVSMLRDLPPGRQGVRTYLAAEDQREKWWAFFRKKLDEGQQGYVITPRVEADEDEPQASAEARFEALANGELEAYRLGLVHGRLSSAEKDEQMDRFRRGDIQVLVATTVVEVGVDVPRATLMTIESGERFGLAQLHQLRGRVARGTQPGYCAIFHQAQTDDSLKRLQALVENEDGFQLAEIDFELRGTGDILGTRQHGLARLLIANLQRDALILHEARQDAQALVAADPRLAAPEWAKLKRQMLRRYGQTLELGDVG